MNIADELREWASVEVPYKQGHQLTAIADRIDAEHEKALREAYNKGCEDGMGVANAKDAQAEYLRGKNDGYDEGWDAGFASADDWLAEHEDAMAKHGWVRLPLDVDEVPWSVGDRDEDGNEVIALKLASDGWYVITDGEWPYRPERKRHYHGPTVEDVLKEFANECLTYATCVDDHEVADAIELYAAKLRLAEGENA